MSDKTKELQEKALKYFDEGHNCAQAVFTVFAEERGMDHDMAFSISAGFGGGIARTQKTCGAVTGAVMAIGLMNDKNHNSPEEQKEAAYTLVQDFLERFTAIHNSTECSQLLGHSLKTAEERREAKEKGLFTNVCNRCVKDAVGIVGVITGIYTFAPLNL